MTDNTLTALLFSIAVIIVCIDIIDNAVVRLKIRAMNREHQLLRDKLASIESGKGKWVTYESYAEACEEASKDMHRIGIFETHFERVCRRLGLEKIRGRSE